ncbi:hypothetical protein TRFO_31237 [Tritrichomonas foetus]|uniref:Uncharacterized protein n=1 Tax=Tritrichomonas foetus TaxID=1144522 RepID=A0A1J4JRW9_9EUKA|nr:hypothetical protein TRFO_31237 [Tritrichomonas foetus]|eukprot:OHT01887.1 hypothetical protein TRFO_31237 [Tritrichomonas foetus]
MWYEEQNHLIRAPVPPSFDSHVKKLEDNDTILFESISLPSLQPLLKKSKTSLAPSPINQTKSKPSFSQSQKTKSEAKAPSSPKVEAFDISDDFISDDEFNDKESAVLPARPATPANINELIEKIHFLEQENIKKDKQIADLKNENKKLKQMKANERKKYTNSPPLDNTANFYKIKYEKTLEQFEKLKEALAADGRMKKYKRRSAREITNRVV